MAENIVLEKQIVEKAKIVSCKISDSNLRKRAFVFNIAANVVADFLNKSGVRTDTKLSLYRVASFAQNLELADIYVEGKRLDVRVTFGDEIFTVPKVHEKYDAQPCAYVVLKLDKTLQNATLLGFVASKDLPKVKSETEYFEYGVSILQPVSELGDFLSQVEFEQKIYSSVDHEKIKELALAFIDDEIAESEKVYFIKHVVSCPVCREVFCDSNDFDMVVGDVKNYPELLSDSTLSVLSGNKQEVDEAALANMSILANESDFENDEVSVDFLNGINAENEETGLEFVENSEEIVEPEEETIFPEAVVPAAPVEFFDEISLDFEDSTKEEETNDADVEANILEEKNTEDTPMETLEFESSDEEMILPMGVPHDIVLEDEDTAEPVVDEEAQPAEEVDGLEFLDSVDEVVEESGEENLLVEESVEDLAEPTFEELPEDEEIVPAVDDFVLEQEEDVLPVENHDEEHNLLVHDEVEESFVLAHDNEHDILNHNDEHDILNHDDEHDFLLEEETEEKSLPIEPEVVEPAKKYDFSLETEVDNTLQEEILLEEQQDTVVEEQFVEEPEEKVYSMSAQEPIELVYDDEEDEQETADTENVEPVEFVSENIESSQDAVEPEENISDVVESNEPAVFELTDTNDSDEQNEADNAVDSSQDNKDDEIQQLLDDDLLALLAEDSSESTEAPIKEVQDDSSQEESTQQQDVSESVEEDSIETLFDESQTQENGEQKEFELAQEPVSAKTVSATKRLLVLVALLFLVAGGGAGMWLFNNAKNQADTVGDGLSQDAEMFDMQNTANDTEAPAISQDINKSMTNSFSDKPAAITITKLSWQISEKLAADDSVKEYLQTAGKNIQMNLQNDLANSADVNFNNIVKVSFELSQENDLKGIQVLESSGSDQIDDIIVRGIKNTLKYVSVPKVKDYDSDYFLTLIINF